VPSRISASACASPSATACSNSDLNRVREPTRAAHSVRAAGGGKSVPVAGSAADGGGLSLAEAGAISCNTSPGMQSWRRVP
jgi:hypothetical protein